PAVQPGDPAAEGDHSPQPATSRIQAGYPLGSLRSQGYTRVVKVVLHDRTNGLGQEVRDTAQHKLTRLERHFGKVVDAEVEFSELRKRSGLSTTVCRISLHLDGRRTPVLQAREIVADPQHDIYL